MVVIKEGDFMRKTFLLLFTLLLIGSLVRCGNIDYSTKYPINKEMQSWLNHPISDVIDAWGQPTQIVPSSEGTVYSWTEDVASRVFNEKKFWVNKSGIIFKWYISGPGTLAPGAGGYNPYFSKMRR